MKMHVIPTFTQTREVHEEKENLLIRYHRAAGNDSERRNYVAHVVYRQNSLSRGKR